MEKQPILPLSEAEEGVIQTLRSTHYGKVSATLVKGEITLVEKTQTFRYNRPQQKGTSEEVL